MAAQLRQLAMPARTWQLAKEEGLPATLYRQLWLQARAAGAWWRRLVAGQGRAGEPQLAATGAPANTRLELIT